jgi:hypothetical protein
MKTPHPIPLIADTGRRLVWQPWAWQWSTMIIDEAEMLAQAARQLGWSLDDGILELGILRVRFRGPVVTWERTPW